METHMHKKLLFLLVLLALTLSALFVSSCGEAVEELDHIHDFAEGVIVPTCTEAGLKYKSCKICNEKVPLNTIPAKGHTPAKDWQLVAEGSCTTSKIEEKICTVCSAVVEKKVHDVVGHDLTEWQVSADATCSQRLVEIRVCKVCEKTVDQRVGNKLSHNYVQIIVPATCAVSEHVLHTCTLCGYSYRDSYTDVYDAHTEGVWVVESAPTCSTDGLRKKVCGVCSVALNEAEAIPMDPNNHSFLIETFPPVGDNEGYTKHTCKRCGYEVTNAYEANLLPSQIYEMIVSSTVRIEACSKDGTLESLGSGFFVTDSGEILTNYHVIAGAYNLRVKLYGGAEYAVAKILAYDMAADLALIKIDLVGNSYLKMSAADVKTGDPVYALGSPLGIDDIFTDGVVANPSKRINGSNFIVFTAPVSPGNSGGPLVNSKGEVVGINTQVLTDGQNLNLALHISNFEGLDTSAPKDVYEVYTETLKIVGHNVLANYLMRNYDKVTPNKEYILERVLRKETASAYGRTMRLMYDSVDSELTVTVNWIDGGRNVYTFEFLIDEIKEEYTVRFFDHVWSQYTAEGKVKSTILVEKKDGMISDAQLNQIFTFDYINYEETNGDPITAQNAKQLVGMAYLLFLEGFEAVLTESDTELTLDTFNFRAAYVEPEAQE